MKNTNEVLWINAEIMTIYNSSGVHICKSKDEFSKLVQQEKKRIAERDYILNRFEPWEISDVDSLRKILVSRSRNTQEKNLVLKYIEHMNK